MLNTILCYDKYQIYYSSNDETVKIFHFAILLTILSNSKEIKCLNAKKKLKCLKCIFYFISVKYLSLICGV